MAWNDPGDDKKDPWERDSKDQPPDLDEVFRNLQKKINGLLGGGGNSENGKESGNAGPGLGGVLVIVLLVGALWAAVNSVHIIEQTQRGVVTRFGAFNRTVTPGLKFIIPIIERIEKVDVTQIRSVTDNGSMLTQDENIVYLEFSIQFKVNNAEQYLFNVRDPIQTLKQAGEAALRQIIGDNDMDFILGSGRAQISADGVKILQDLLDRYKAGLVITTLNLQDVRPPQQVQGAFDDAVKAREDKETYVNEAEAYANGVLPKARGQAARISQEAEAYKSRVIAISTGEASRFSQLMTEYEKAPEVTRKRLYIETMEDVMSRTGKVLASDKGNQLMMLPLQEMLKQNGVVPGKQQADQNSGGRSTIVTPSSASQEALRDPSRNAKREPR